MFGEFAGGPVVRTLLSLLRARVQSLVGELRSHNPHGVAKKYKHKHRQTNEEKKIDVCNLLIFYLGF